ncbi:S8 family serine peptidase [Aliidiomarina halalkaliphila]|uniref:S8 family serine peptidase n=1 Tax=Aliidiomarina halalkaliphila TaxID=2593535 RepID=A0A552X4C5_9GAMM|nr:S8 family serine peptidase [Aliidiomarina halalkaliphila]TRW49870.1 S8 family serine peptidase [Aliidiomarina halalkaliphila]
MPWLARTLYFTIAASIALIPLLASSQQAPNVPNVPVVNPAERAIERQIERATRQAERLERNLPSAAEIGQARALEQIASNTERTIERLSSLDPLSNLPERLSIRDKEGVERFVDIEIEPGRRAIERQWVLMLDNEALAQFPQQAPELWKYLTENETLSGLGQNILTFTVPRHLDNRAGVERLVPTGLHQALDRNHIYQATGDLRPEQMPSEQASIPVPPLQLQWPARSVCTAPLRIGVVDTGIHSDHPAFAQAVTEGRLIRRGFLDRDIPQPGHHGTAVTGILIGAAENHPALLPDATVYHAEVFYQQSVYHQGASLTHLIRALSWLSEQQVQAINLSLTGPENRLLAQTVRRLHQANIAVIAAVGNDGPHAPKLYPAAYDEVIGATAVDSYGRIYRWANQGEHVEFAGFGVSVLAPRADNQWGYESGTSMAAPFVTAHAACSAQDTVTATRAELKKRAYAEKQERDPTIGFGVLHPALIINGVLANTH